MSFNINHPTRASGPVLAEVEILSEDCLPFGIWLYDRHIWEQKDKDTNYLRPADRVSPLLGSSTDAR
jgi:hypothetical protein